MYIFIDANIYLNYFRMSNDTIVSLKRLKEHIKQNKDVELILPVQTQNEFYKNKNVVIAQSFKVLNNAVEILTNLSNTSTNNKIKDEVRKFRKEFKDFLTDKNSDINTLIDSLFELAKKYDDDGDIFDKAYKRMIKRLPPGKPDSVGDAIAWEILLRNCKEKPLYIISNDGDWSDEIKDNELKPFLLREWGKVNSKQITLFKSIGEFLNRVSKAKISKEVIQEEKSLPYPFSVLLGTSEYSNMATLASASTGYSGYSSSAPNVWLSGTSTPLWNSVIIGNASPYYYSASGEIIPPSSEDKEK